jgi:hypothetical protein
VRGYSKTGTYLEDGMKSYIVAAAILAAMTTAASAKCSTKSLNGNWMLGSDDTGNPVPVVFKNGVGKVGGVVTYQVTLGKNCKGTVTITQTGWVGRLATERLSPTSILTPNTLQIGIPAQTVGANTTSGVLLTMFRL